MDNYQKFGHISGQVFIGMGFGIGTAILSIIIAGLYHDRLDLLGIGMYGLIGFYIGNLIGIGYDGFKLLKKLGRQRSFYRFFIQSIIGTLLGITLLYYGRTIFGQGNPQGQVTRVLVNLLIIVLPLTGATIGFNFRLPYTEKKDR
jgi:hypothetical protein